MKKIKIALLALLCFAGTDTKTNAQTTCTYATDVCGSCATITLPPDPTICPGGTYAFNVGSSVSVPWWMTVATWTWSPATPAPPGGTGMPGWTTFTPATTTTYTLVVDAQGPNLINDGDFESWSPTTPCFSTGYTYYTGIGMAGFNDVYTVDVNPHLYAPLFDIMGDHTSGSGNMLIVKGDINTTPVANTIVWEESQIPVCAGEPYTFDFWYADIDPGGGDNPVLQIYINGSPYGTPFTPTVYGTWIEGALYWTPPTGVTIADIQIVDLWTSFNNNDFALDDISLRRHCKVAESFTINVDAPSLLPSLSVVCVGDAAPLTATPPGGTFTYGPGISVSPSGWVTGLIPGVWTVTYTDPAGCTATAVVSVNPNPVSLSGGPSAICVGSTLSLTGTPSGGPWANNPNVIPVTPPGVYEGVIPGIAVIDYFFGGCYAEFTATVNPVPDTMDDIFLCVGDVESLMDAPAGGTWTCSPATVATITPTGTITGVGPGVATVTYMLGTCSISFNAYVNECGGGSGGYLCLGSGTTLTGSPAGGTWTSSDYSIAPITPGGAITTIPGSITVPTMITFSYSIGGSVVMTVTLLIQPPVTACVKTVTIGTPGTYAFVFSSTCTGSPCYIKYHVYDYMGNLLSVIPGSGGVDWTTAGTTIPYSTIALWYAPDAFTVCVDSVWCNGCWWPADCCASVNPGPRSSYGLNNGTPAVKEPLKIIPNPNNGSFNIAGDIPNSITSKDAKIEIVNMLGEVIYTDVASTYYGAMSKTIALSNDIANGVYLLKIKADDGGGQIIRFTLQR